MAGRIKWNSKRIQRLKDIYPITEDWEILLKEFPFSTYRGILHTAGKHGLKKLIPTNAYLSHDNTLFDIWTEKSAYLLGYLEADGYLFREKRVLGVTFATSPKDKDFIVMLKKLVKFDGTLSKRLYKLEKKDYPGLAFTVRSRKWKGSYLELIRRGSIPKEIPENLLHHYIRGYFDGDGCIYWSTQAACYQSNIVFGEKALAEDFAKKLRKITGSKLTIHLKTSSDKCWYINFAREGTKKFSSYLYKDATIFLKRKFEKAMKAIGE